MIDHLPQIQQVPQVFGRQQIKGFNASIAAGSPNAWWKMNAPNTATGGQFAHGGFNAPGTGVASSYYASVAHAASQNVTNLTITLDVLPKSLTANGDETLIAKGDGAAPNRNFQVFRNNGMQTWVLLWTDNASATQTQSFSPALTLGQRTKLRFSLKVDNGAGGYTAKCEKSVDGGLNWTTVNTVTGGATTSILAITKPIYFGQLGTSGIPFGGIIYSGTVQDGVGSGPVVCSVDFTTLAIGTVTFTESSVNAAAVTVVGPIAADYVSPFSSEAIALNGAVFGAAGAVGSDSAMTFDGINDQLVTQPVSLVCGQAALSVFGFIKTATTGKAMMFSSGASNDLTFKIVTHTLLLTLSDHTTTDTLPGAASVDDNLWHEVGFVISAGKCQMYVDGLPDGGNTSILGSFAGAQAAVLRLMTDTTNFFNGSAQHWRVYQRALSAAEIASNYSRRGRS